MIIVTGGAGFIGSNFVLEWLARNGEPVVNIDKLTYAGNLNNLAAVHNDARHLFLQGDICDRSLVRGLFQRFQPHAIVHFAAETHVDRSIHDSETFLKANVMGTHTLLEEALVYWRLLSEEAKRDFRFLHVSTDEVFGTLNAGDPAFNETSPYAPNNPYSASKAASDHMVRAYHATHQLPTIVSNCSNNYGPFQFPEKLIPLMTINATKKLPLPVYGDGLQERNWLYVTDHCSALRLILEKGECGESYMIGGEKSRSNIELISMICLILDEELAPAEPHASLIRFVEDRPGHDYRYDIDSSKIQRELGWKPAMEFAEGIRQTVKWYLNNSDWVEKVMTGEYQNWINTHYAKAG